MSKSLYPKIKPIKQEFLPVSEHHEIYVEQSGNPDGIAVLYLHGGPGGGSSENHRRYFDPERYHIILIDQRGCGRSNPSPNLSENTTWDLVQDIEKVREHLSIQQWLVAGGSWGTTLALAYGISHPDRVLAFILRGIFLGTEQEFQWLYSHQGAARFFPEYYRDFISVLPIEDRLDPLQGYYKMLTCENEVAVIAASKAWALWELRLSSTEHHHVGMSQVSDTHQAICMAKISSHYFVNQCYFSPEYLLEEISKIKHLPAIIIHGRYDMVCQLDLADKLMNRWQNAHLQIMPSAGHSGFEKQTIDAFCKATDSMAKFLSEVSKNK
ncbi:prolyl aminopeptidase [Thalassotalea atypica]|uniref:prolyl aminopeptidase n=1 Tax=Thalassotalea atypica TaxID=2054316 RepID=UPI00257247A7|nr:prolyl aminopeptidase [Thalassotalea atypica]